MSFCLYIVQFDIVYKVYFLIYNGYATGQEGEELGYADESDTDAIIAYRQRYPHPTSYTSYKLKYPWNLK